MHVARLRRFGRFLASSREVVGALGVAADLEVNLGSVECVVAGKHRHVASPTVEVGLYLPV